jgi:drug/metabolite transporter (DMT)-like permease
LILHHIPFPSLVVAFQLSATIIFIYTAKYACQLPVDALERRYIIPYLYYIIAFAGGVFCNMKSISMSNVETVIVFRSLSPCLVSVLDALFLGREWPSRRSQVGLATIVLGAYGYASYDDKFQSQGLVAYIWPTLYLFIISFEMAYGKRIIRSVELKTKSGPVLYTNLLGIFPMLLFAVLAGEPRRFHAHALPIPYVAYVYLFLGCAVGTGIGYSSWWCRDQVSATSFTIIGVMNKCLTVVLNVSIWDQHAPPGGIACLALCLLGGTIYQQAPMRSLNAAAAATVAANNADVWDTMTEEGSERTKSLADEEAQQQGLLGSGMKQRKN